MNNNIDASAIFPFELDKFQKQAIQYLEKGKSILVCAPTGAGKTAIAEYAIHLALAKKQKIFYTTPLKALSNQKFFDLCKHFGENQIGLLTGDIQVNREAQIVVLTTEIFRNMLYSQEESEFIEKIGFVVLDECHYMKDPDRGTVWEESIIYCPSHAQIIGLSATIGNPESINAWINQVHGESELILSAERPVPLRFFFFGREGFKTLITAGGKINPTIFKNGGGKQHKKPNKNNSLPTLVQVIKELAERNMLPAIYFLFSRRGCEEAVRKAAYANLNLLKEEERTLLKAELDKACKDLPWLAEHPHFKALSEGLAPHHAGLLPAIKSLVENLFQKNLLKVVFATETLAAGINMPARSVVISQISKRTDSGHRLLNGSEFLQMGGRAGRRGMDDIGYVIVLETLFEGPLEISHLAMASPEELHSSFAPSYIMVLNLTAKHSWEKCRNLVLSSFARFEKLQEIKTLQNTSEQLMKNLTKGQKKDFKLKNKTDKKLHKVNSELKRLEELPWPEFEKAADVLRHFDYLSAEQKPTQKGLWAADLRGDNILFLAEMLDQGIMNNLTSYELAGLACAMSNYEVRWQQNSLASNWAITEQVQVAARKAYDLIKHISKIQSHYEIYNRIPFTPTLIELGFDWANDYTWQELVDKYKADEGDLVKSLRQGADLLKQFISCKGSSTDLIQNANQAYNLIYRSPIKDEII